LLLLDQDYVVDAAELPTSAAATRPLKRLSLKTQYKDIASKYPDATPSIQQLLKVLCDGENLANSTPISVGESKEWAAIISSAEDNREDNCKVLKGKTLFSTLYGTYSDATRS
jgi:hypothetical protein